jgi:predicted nucleic-acid-binding Zn-ribbon protein
MMLLLQCPKCKNRMKYQSKTVILTGKRKTCVYCGRNFKVRDNLIKKVQ